MKKFSLIEVLIAFTILSVAAVMAMEILTRSGTDVYDAEQDFARQHLLANSVEYYLLAGHRAEAPQNLLPTGITVSCELIELPLDEGLDPNEVPEGWILAEYQVKLFDQSGEIASQNITKIVPSNEL